MRYCCILFFLCITSVCFSNISDDSIYINLEKVLANKISYTEFKEDKISEIKKLLKTPFISEQQRYDINHQLYDAYKTFITDSAIVYIRENINIAQNTGDQHRLLGSRLDLTGLYSIMGLYVEAFNEINELGRLNRNNQPNWFLPYYYNVCSQTYRSYSLLNDVYANEYRDKGDLYRDSLLRILPPDEQIYKIIYAEKLLENNQLEESQIILNELFNNSNQEDHEHAVLAFALSNVYKAKGDLKNQKKYLAISATADIKNAIKENSSMQILASILYENGDIENAYKCIRSSMEDAMFCNARLRTFAVSKIFPIIDSAYQESTEKQHKTLTSFLIAVSILSVMLMIAIGYVYKQMKRIARIRRELHCINVKLKDLNNNLQKSNNKLSDLNIELSNVNSELSDANQLKEAYISHFLDLCSTYIDKLKRYQYELNKKAVEKKLDELYRMLKSSNMIDAELKELYENFDKTFLHLYPNFIRDFNKLLIDSAQFDINATELSIELRIFALIRLGITDSSKIASFLHYSANTIYSYRTRMRNKAAVSREDFDDLVRKIGLISK